MSDSDISEGPQSHYAYINPHKRTNLFSRSYFDDFLRENYCTTKRCHTKKKSNRKSRKQDLPYYFLPVVCLPHHEKLSKPKSRGNYYKSFGNSESSLFNFEPSFTEMECPIDLDYVNHSPSNLLKSANFTSPKKSKSSFYLSKPRCFKTFCDKNFPSDSSVSVFPKKKTNFNDFNTQTDCTWWSNTKSTQTLSENRNKKDISCETALKDINLFIALFSKESTKIVKQSKNTLQANKIDADNKKKAF